MIDSEVFKNAYNELRPMVLLANKDFKQMADDSKNYMTKNINALIPGGGLACLRIMANETGLTTHTLFNAIALYTYEQFKDLYNKK